MSGFAQSVSSTTGQSNTFKTIIRAALLSFVFSLVLVLVFALIIKLTDISENVILIVNQVIKVISVFFGVLFAVNSKQRWFLKGLLGGALYAVLSFFVFSLMSGMFDWAGLAIDTAIASSVGVLGAMLAAAKK